MYQILGIKKSLSYFGILCAILVLLIQLVSPNMGVFRLISTSVAVASGLIFLAGQTPVFPWFCRKILKFFPDIDGVWTAELLSNWPMIASRQGIEDKSEAPIKAEIKIIARLFTIKMRLDSGYSESKTMAIAIRKDEEDGEIKLYYLYENSTPVPNSTDSGRHFGAAQLKVVQTGERTVLRGEYWTNRNWEKALNTAGTITLQRP